jgi:hypothetical protein
MSRLAFDPTRYRGILVVAAFLLAALGTINLLLHFVAGPDPAWLRPDEEPIDWKTYEKAGRIVAGVDRLKHAGRWEPHDRLGVVVGMSTAAFGFQPRILEDQSGVADHWVVLNGFGLTFRGLEDVVQPLLVSDTKPNVVLLAVHPQMLIGQGYLPPSPPPNQLSDLVGSVKAGKLRGAVTILPRWLHLAWVLDHQPLVSHDLRLLLYAARLGLFRACGHPADVLFPPVADPWHESSGFLGNEFDENCVAVQLDRWQKRGYFQAHRYDPDGLQADALLRMVEGFRERGADVCIVLMPERSSLRNLIPPEAKRCLRTVLRSRFGDNPPPVLDFQETMADAYFADLAHLSGEGSSQFTTLVAQELRQRSSP